MFPTDLSGVYSSVGAGRRLRLDPGTRRALRRAANPGDAILCRAVPAPPRRQGAIPTADNISQQLMLSVDQLSST